MKEGMQCLKARELKHARSAISMNIPSNSIWLETCQAANSLISSRASGKVGSITPSKSPLIM